MFYNDTRKQMKALAEKIMRGNRRRNVFVVIAIAMTSFLISSVICIGGGYWKSAERQRRMQNGTAADLILTNPTSEQVQALGQDKSIRWAGISRQIGFVDTAAYPRINSILLRWCDRTEWERHIIPAVGNISGHYPESSGEIMLPKWVLERMGIDEPVIGQTVTLSFRYGYTDVNWRPLSDAKDFSFTLCGWYDDCSVNKMYDNAVAYISEEFWRNSAADETNTKSALSISGGDRSKILSYIEPLNELQEFTELSKGEGGKNSVGPVLAALGLIVVIMVCGYLLIYNVFYISVTKDIRMYGQLKTLGTTERQLKRVIDRQVLELSFWGIFLGLSLSLAAVFRIVPFGIRALAGDMIMSSAVSFSYSPLIFVGAGLFSLFTAWIGSRTPAKIAGRVSPVEALNFSGVKASGKNSGRTSRGSKVFKMAAGNVFRNKKGAVLVLSSLFLGISLFVIVNGVLAGLDASVLAEEYMEDDIVIELSPNTDPEGRILTDLEKAPDVREISVTTKKEQWFADPSGVLEKYIADFCSVGTVSEDAVEQFTDGNKYQTYLIGIGEQDFYRAAETINSALEYEDFREGKAAFLASATIVPYAKTAVSGKIQLLFGERAHELEIAPYFLPATFRADGRTLIAPVIYVSQEWLNGIGQSGPVSRIALQTGNSRRALQAVSDMLDNYGGAAVTAKLEKADELRDSFGGVTFLGNAVSVILLCNGLMNFINMMYVSVNSRRRELAVLESVGMTKKQICRMLRLEGNTYAFITALLMVTVGSAALYGSFRLVKLQAAYAVFVYPLVPVVLSLAVVTAICSLVPVIVYRAKNGRSIVERLRGDE